MKTLNILGLTQGANIDVLVQLLEVLKQTQAFRHAGFELGAVTALVSHRRHFETSPVPHRSCLTFIKEWEVIEQGREHTPDKARLQAYEAEMSPGSIWSAIIGDRRLIYGRYAKFTEDYRVHFTDRQLYAMAQIMLDRLAQAFRANPPDLVLGFTPVTFGELLALEYAAARNIPTLQLHSARIRNYFALFDNVRGMSNHIHALQQNPAHLSDEALRTAQDVFAEIYARGALYEGVNMRLKHGRSFSMARTLRTLPSAIKWGWLCTVNSAWRHDHHDPGAFRPWLFEAFHQPWRAAHVRRFLRTSDRWLAPHELVNHPSFAFYPLHAEPEVAIQVLGRPYHKNQIELLRNLAASLPAGMALIVKEHPRSMGLRPVAFYRSLMQIPNLYFVDNALPSTAIIPHATLVTVISSTIGLEAIIAGKPVLVLGIPKYGTELARMVKSCYNLFELPLVIRTLLKDYTYQKEPIICLLASLIQGSVAIDLYSALLAKAERYAPERPGGEDKRYEDYRALALYTLERIEHCLQQQLKSEPNSVIKHALKGTSTKEQPHHERR